MVTGIQKSSNFAPATEQERSPINRTGQAVRHGPDTVSPLVHRSFTARSPHVHRTFTARSPHVHRTFTARHRSFSVRSPFDLRSISVRSPFYSRSIFVLHSFVLRYFSVPQRKTTENNGKQTENKRLRSEEEAN